MYKLAGWKNDIICRIATREMIRGISAVFGTDAALPIDEKNIPREEICQLFLHQCANKHVFDHEKVTPADIAVRVQAMMTELQDPDHAYAFDATGTLILYFCINTTLENSQDSGIEWISVVTEEEKASAKEFLQDHMKASLATSGMQDFQIKTLLRGYVPALVYIISHFTEYNSELGIGSYADILTENVIYHNYDFLNLADNGYENTSSHFPEGASTSYRSLSGSAQYEIS